MSGYRPERVAEMIHRELAQRLRLEVKDPELTPISITAVRVTRDLSRATIEYLPLGGSSVPPALAGALERASRQLRGPIGRALRLRTAPELVFVRDSHTEQAIAVTSLLAKLSRERGDGGEEE